ncbi:MAG TPA: hypothetical protein VMM93_00780 [Vicinamibacterales bacterium]|nr:hypothetical protein [Vicinamibacterales bacterium]
MRDPAIRAAALTATRSWTVSGDAGPPAEPFERRLAGSTQYERPIGGRDVVYLDLTAPGAPAPMMLPPITWQLDGQPVADAIGQLTFPLDLHRLSPGTHTMAVRVGDETRTWTVDNTPPTVAYTLSPTVASIATDAGSGTPHVFMRDEFTMQLDPADDQPGYVVAEFRLNGDGWHHYYGWPDAPPGTPFRFTPRGTNIKELIYGSLSAEGLSPQPWEPREPGWGSHRIEYRAIDAAGNIGDARDFRVTIMPGPECARTVTGQHAGDLRVDSGVTCVIGATVTGSIAVAAGASLVATDARIGGGITAARAADVELVATTVAGDVRIEGTVGRVVLFGATVTGATTVSGGGSTPARLIGSTFGTLTCAGNGEAPVNGGTPNRLPGGATGQCAGL